jgi:hypothetical protein
VLVLDLERGPMTPVAALCTSTSSGPSAAHLVEHALGRDVAAHEDRLGPGRASSSAVASAAESLRR